MKKKTAKKKTAKKPAKKKSEEGWKEEEVSSARRGFSLLSSWCVSSARAGDRTTDDLRSGSKPPSEVRRAVTGTLQPSG
jgi:hypothetical protein